MSKKFNYNDSPTLWQNYRTGHPDAKPCVVDGHIAVGTEIMARCEDDAEAIQILSEAGYKAGEFTINSPTCTFSIENGVWNAILDGEMIRATFNSKGAAEAGIEVERRRREDRSASRKHHCPECHNNPCTCPIGGNRRPA